MKTKMQTDIAVSGATESIEKALPEKNPTACVLVIGNELLSGQTQDENLPYLARRLHEKGLDLTEARFVRDTATAIGEAVRWAQGAYDYVFTTGGIGPTHDDITAASIAGAFGLPLVCSLEAYRRMREKYPQSKAPDALARMSVVPAGSSLLLNPLSAAPGFKLHNIYVLAGVPNIMRAMFEELAPHIQGGQAPYCQEILVNAVEGVLAQELENLQTQYHRTEIGSYPLWTDQEKNPGKHQVRIVVKGFFEDDVMAVAQKVTSFAETLTQG